MTTRILVGDCRLIMAQMDADSVDSIVTDPPYGIEFMGKQWDSFKPNARSGKRADGGPSFGSNIRYQEKGISAQRAFQEWTETWAAEALRVLKPGGHMLSFGGTRTFHRMVSGVENAGFEIRDTIAWLYGVGYPKNPNALKPAMEPIIVARKPLRGTVAANVAAHGTGAINIDGCRIETDARPVMVRTSTVVAARAMAGESTGATSSGEMTTLGRWPANVVLDEEAAAQLDEQTGETVSRIGKPRGSAEPGNGWGMTKTGAEYDDAGGASRFFYCAKADRSEREIGMDGVEAKPLLWSSGEQSPGTFQAEGTNRTARNNHPTVKPISLMRWLVRLVTPPGGTVLDPFCGSGTTGIASDREGFHSILIDITPEYAEISRKRITGDAPMFADVTVEPATRAGYVESEVA